MTYPAVTGKNAVQVAEQLLEQDADHRVSAQIDQGKFVTEKQGEFDIKQLDADVSAILDKWNELLKLLPWFIRRYRK